MRVHCATWITSPALPAAFVASAYAQTPVPSPLREHTWTANAEVFSEYIFRGIAQTAGKRAIQGGFDYAHASGYGAAKDRGVISIRKTF
jgi:uncharacterized protein (TIGR02001 family)